MPSRSQHSDRSSFLNIDGTSQASEPINLRWWSEEDPAKRASILFEVGKDMDLNNADRCAVNWVHLRMYNGQTRDSYTGYGGSRQEAMAAGGGVNNSYGNYPRAMTFNLIQSITNTLVARVSANEIKITFLTDEGTYAQVQKARKLDRLIEGVFYQCNMKRVAVNALRDAHWADVGCIHVCENPEKPGTILLENVFPNELATDRMEALYGSPRQLFRYKLMPRDVAIAKYAYDVVLDENGDPELDENEEPILRLNKEKAQALSECKTPSEITGIYAKVADVIVIREAWHLRSSEDSEDGVHAICCERGMLHDEPWKKDYFPFVFIRFEERPLGFWGQSCADMLTGLQVEMNRLLKYQQRCLQLMSQPHWYVQRGSKINLNHINNAIGGIIEGDMPEPPQLMKMDPVSDNVIQAIENIYHKAYEIIGLSQLTAQSLKPAGLDSGAALRVYEDNQTERFSTLGTAYERMHLEVAKQVIGLIRDIYERDGDFSIRTPGRKFLKTISWKDIDLDDDEYFMKLYPTNMLPKDPAGRLQTLNEMVQAGMLQSDEALSLLDYPDLERFTSLTNAAIDDIMATIDDIIINGHYEPPEPEQNLTLGLKLFTQAYLKSKHQSDVTPQSRIMLLNWLRQAMTLAATAPQMSAPAPGQPTGSAPPAQPASLLPNTAVAGAGP